MENMSEAQPQRYLSIQDVSRIYGISRSTIYKLLGEKRIEAVKAGAKVLIRSESVDHYMSLLSPVNIAVPTQRTSAQSRK